MDSDKSPLVSGMPPPPYNESRPAPQGVGVPPPPTYGAAGGQAYTTNVTVVTEAPRPVPTVGSAPPVGRPSNYLIWSILTALFCSLPFGVAAIVYSLRTSSAYEAGEYELALRASRTARTLNIIGLVVGIVLYVVVIIITVARVAVIAEV